MTATVDQSARDRIRTALNESLCVEAGAGTGKTTVVLDRVVEAVASGTAGLDGLAVITFTEKSANDLRERIAGTLDSALALTAEHSEEHARLLEARSALPRAAIGTIHAFCVRILREFAVEAGVDPDFHVLEPVEADAVFDEALDQWKAPLLSGQDNAMRCAFSRGLRLKDLRKFAQLLAVHDELVLTTPLSPHPDVDALRSALSTALPALRGVHQRSQDLAAGDPDAAAALATSKRAVLVERVLRFGDETEATGDEDLLAALCLTGTITQGEQRLDCWPHQEDGREAGRVLKQLAVPWNDALRAAHAEALVGIWPAVAAFVERAEAQRRRDGEATFDDLLRWTRDLLHDDRSVRQLLRGRYRSIVVDEFQDTDPVQTEIISMLTSVDASADGVPEAGRLVVVGDPKQSIYRFRRADLTVYDQLKSRMSDASVVAITQNFRSHRGLLSWVNRVFTDLIVREEGVQPGYFVLDTEVPALAAQAPVIVARRITDGSALEVRVAEARLVADTLADGITGGRWRVRDRDGDHVVERPARWGDVAILMRARTGLIHYEAALAEAGIPYRIEAGNDFFGRQEIRELREVLRCIDDPSDTIATAAALRATAFGCSDADLAGAVAACGRLDILASPVAGAVVPERVATATSLLVELHRRRHALTVADLVAELLDRTRLAATHRSLPGGSQRSANVRKLVVLADEFDTTVGGGVRGFVAYLTTAEADAVRIADAEDELDPDDVPTEGGDDVVRIMTIHGAKGREFPIVVLPNLNTQSNQLPDVIVDRDGDTVDIRVWREFMSPGYLEAQKGEKIHAEAERRRLLYVAATRTKDLLVVPLAAAEPKAMLATIEDYLAAVPGEVDVVDPPEAPPGDSGADTVTAGDQDVARVQTLRDEWSSRHDLAIASAAAPPRLVTASGTENWADARQAHMLPIDRAGMDPREFGTALHRTIELAGLDAAADAVRAAAAVAAAEAGSEGAAVDEASAVDILATAAGRALALPVAVRARAADHVEHEWPCTAVRDDDGVVVEGRIDMLFREPSGAVVVVDWKSDAVTATDLDDRLDVYRGQAAVYAWLVGRSIGAPVSEVVYAFVHAGEERSIVPDATLTALVQSFTGADPDEPASTAGEQVERAADDEPADDVPDLPGAIGSPI